MGEAGWENPASSHRYGTRASPPAPPASRIAYRASRIAHRASPLPPSDPKPGELDGRESCRHLPGSAHLAISTILHTF